MMCRRLQRDQVARVLDRDRAVQLRGALEAALEPGLRGGDVRLLARGRAVADALEGREALADQRQRALLRGHHGEVGAQRMRRREVGILGERLVERRERIAEVAERLLHGQFVVLERGDARGRDRQAARIGQFHVGSSSVGGFHGCLCTGSP